jgi:hypothetical protein
MESYQTDQAEQVASPQCLHLYDLGRDFGEPSDRYPGMAVSERGSTG